MTIEFPTKRDIPTAPVFRPLLEMARYKGAWGGPQLRQCQGARGFLGARSWVRHAQQKNRCGDDMSITPIAALCFPEPQLSDVKHHGTPGESQSIGVVHSFDHKELLTRGPSDRHRRFR